MKKYLSFMLAGIMLVASVVPASAAQYSGKINGAKHSAEDYTAAQVQIGDVDMDGRVIIKDATVVQKYSADLEFLSEYQLYVADVDNSGAVNVKDATMIQKKIAGIIDEFPARDDVNKDDTSEDEVVDAITPDEVAPEETAPEVTEPATEVPTEAPTEDPTEVTTETPTEAHTVVPTATPTEDPTEVPTEIPTGVLTEAPTLSDIELYAPVDIHEGDFVTSEMLWVIEQEFFRLVNEDRLNLSWECDAVVHNKALDDAAQIRSEELKVLYSHTRPDGSQCFGTIEDYDRKALGEIIWCFYIGSFTGTDEELVDIGRHAFEGFKASKPHYDIMMDEYFEETGIGITYDLKYDGIMIYISCFYGAQW